MLIKEELNIISVEEMFSTPNLVIPDYQRPYKWGEKNIKHLINDIKKSMEKNKNKYRIGTIILHKDDKKNKYNIVDGQQRLISLTILLYALEYEESKLCLLEYDFPKVSQENIKNNYKFILEFLKLLKIKKIDMQKYKDYILRNCEFVKIVTDNEQEAFQFFDSQNSRGKPLYPHDLLKAYHLREMVEEDKDIDDDTKDIITKWESVDKEGAVELADLFKYYLYPIKQWIKLKDGLGKTPKRGNLSFDSQKIDTFKGIKTDCSYNFAKYHRRNQGNYKNECKDIFQLDQEIIAGKPFFSFVQHYRDLLNKIQEIIKEKRRNNEILKVPNENLVKKIYESVLLFYVDKFYDEPKKDEIDYIDYFFKWAYYLRIEKGSVYELSLNKYAIETCMFQSISEAKNPDDIFSIELSKPEERSKDKKDKYSDLYNYLNSKKEEN
jgi:DNA-directed RNA polymerase beta subunit